MLGAPSHVRIVATAIVLGVFAVPESRAEELDALLDPEATGGAVGEEPDESRSAPPERPTRRFDTAEPKGKPVAVPDEGPEPSPIPPQRRVIEEIIVTAQKREQSLRDVPISMSVLDDAFLDQESITDYQDLGRFVPNLVVDNASLFPDLRIRGLGSQLTNKAFEQSVGLSIDGVPYGRSHYFIGPLFDLARIEVLRGPQGTLFGKNTTAGLLNVVTNRPTSEFTGFVDSEIGELDRRRFEAGIGGPILARTVNFRVSGLLDERDGIIRNTTKTVAPDANDRMIGWDRKAIRAQLGFPDLLGADLIVSYEKIDVDPVGAGFEIIAAPPGSVAFFREWDPRADVRPGNFVGSTDLGEFASLSFDTFVANASYGFGDWRLDGVAGHSVVTLVELNDVDFSPAPMIYTAGADENPQTTAELRVASPPLPGLLGLDRLVQLPLGSSELSVGLFWQRREIADSSFAVGFNVPVLAQFAAFQAPDGNVPTVGTVPIPPLPLPPPGPIEDFVGVDIPLGDRDVFDTTENLEEGTTFFEHSQDALAGFGQVVWRPFDRWALQYGMRFSHEKKKAHWSRVVTKGTGLFLMAVNQEEFVADRSRKEVAFTPDVSLTWDWREEVSLYARWARGVKAGGYNEFALNDDQPLEFDTETATSWEFGTKTSLLSGAATLNVGLFWQDVTDLQVLTLLPQELVPQVVNAGEARVHGLEADAIWLPTGWATFRGTLAFTDSEFLEFPFGTCAQDRPDTDGDGDQRCDHRGQPFFRTPKWASTLTGTATIPLTSILPFRETRLSSWDGIALIGSLTAEYVDIHFLSDTFDPRTRQPSFFSFDASLGLGDAARGWSLRFNVENLTNEVVGTIIREIPLGIANFTQRPEAPRLFFGSFRWAF